MSKRKRLKESRAPRNIIIATKPYAAASEQFRTIRTNIMYSSIDVPIKSVLCTSATPESGKSTVAVNIAVAYAQTGIKTLLLDADLRRPTSHYTFEVTNQTGLSTAVVNDVPLEEVVKQTQFEQLDLITSGPIPPNPSELLASQRMNHFMNEISMHYGMIIIDSPPLLAVTDGQILSQKADGVLLVTNVENNNRNELKEAKNLLNKADANIIGVVLNNRDIKSTKDGQYYYYGISEE